MDWSIEVREGGSPFGGIPRNWKLLRLIANGPLALMSCSPFGGIPRNWKRSTCNPHRGRVMCTSSPFGGIPRNWKLECMYSLALLRLMFPLRGDP